ncbi:MAG: hypothetical protein IKW84_04235 [Bacteroidaceae bacterium]|nr:hypothetical protein [Bacteroidaceae bacterium]
MSYIFSQLPGCLLAILTILLALMFLCAWKAPRWVRPIGSIALAISAIHYIYGLILGFHDIQVAGDISPNVMVGGLKFMFIAWEYILFIYLISRIIGVIQKRNS